MRSDRSNRAKTTFKAPVNPAEKDCWDKLHANGWTTLRKGWPDIIAFKEDKVCCIEVKTKRGHRLKKHQGIVLNLLASQGVTCYRWDPENGFQNIVPPKPSP